MDDDCALGLGLIELFTFLSSADESMMPNSQQGMVVKINQGDSMQGAQLAMES